MELLKTYNDIITNQSKWNPTLVNIGVNFTELFDPNKFETQNLLTSLLFWESNTCDFAINTHKIRCNMGYNRQAHTISLFLLGIEVASKIGFNKFSLPKWDTNEQRNFLHFWAITCLCHDIGYYFEKEYTQNYPKSIDELMEILGAKFDLRDNSNKTILEGY